MGGCASTVPFEESPGASLTQERSPQRVNSQLRPGGQGLNFSLCSAPACLPAQESREVAAKAQGCSFS